MNKTFFIAWPIVFVAWMAGSFLIHGTALANDYYSLPNLFRSPEDSSNYAPLMLVAHVLMAGAFAWIYGRGVEAKAWLPQGLRYGLAIALLTAIPTYTIYYVVQPMPPELVAKQIGMETVLLLVLGVIVAFLYRNHASPKN